MKLPRPLVALFLAFGAAIFAFALRGELQPLEFWFYDVGFSSRAARAPSDLVILGIDERFMAGRHAYLAPRDRLAKLIRSVAAGHPRAIALDVWLDSHIDEKGDRELRDALLFARKLKVPVILADVPAASLDTDLSTQNGQTAHGAVISYFKCAAAGVGDVTFVPDDDGAIRWHEIEGDSPSLAWQMARFPSGNSQNHLKHSARLQRERAPLDFCGPPGTIPTQKAADFLENPVLGALLENQTVFIGATYPRSFDFQSTPFRASKMYGVEILAQATDSLRRGAIRHSHELAGAQWFDFGLVLLTAILVALTALTGTFVGVLAALMVMLAASMAAILSAQGAGTVAIWGGRFHPATPFLSAVPLALLGAIAWRSVLQGRELRLVRDTFGAYVGAQVLEALGGKMPELGGETRPIAVLFCDIRGYSALAESMSNDPKALLDELNAHFAPLVAALQKRGAYVDNYVGDLVMALFGAPFSVGSYQKDIQAAVSAALDFISIIEERNAARREKGLFPIEVGIGVHCGEAVVGNMGSTNAQNGSKGKIHYTAIGDVVNVASRIESATRGQNVALLVTREVVEAVGKTADLPNWNRIGEIVVKGRAAPVEIFKIA